MSSFSKSVSKEEFLKLVASSGSSSTNNGEGVFCKWEFKRGSLVGRFCGRRIKKGKNGLCCLHCRNVNDGGGKSRGTSVSPSVSSVRTTSSSFVSFSTPPNATRTTMGVGTDQIYEDEEIRRQFPIAEKIYGCVIENKLVEESVIPFPKAKIFSKSTAFGNIPPKQKIMEILFSSSSLVESSSSVVLSKAPSIFDYRFKTTGEIPPGEKSEELTTPLMGNYLFESPIMRSLFFTQSKVWWKDLFEGLYHSFLVMDVLTLRSDLEVRTSKNAGRKDSIERYKDILKIMFENYTSMNFQDENQIETFSKTFKDSKLLVSLWSLKATTMSSSTQSQPQTQSLYEMIFKCVTEEFHCSKEYVEPFVSLICAVVMFLSYSVVRENVSIEEYVKIALCACCCFNTSSSTLTSPTKKSTTTRENFLMGFIPKAISKDVLQNSHASKIVKRWLDEMTPGFFASFCGNEGENGEMMSQLINTGCIAFLNEVSNWRSDDKEEGDTIINGIQIEEFMGLVVIVSYVCSIFNFVDDEDGKKSITGIFSEAGRQEGLNFKPRKKWSIKEFGKVRDYGSRQFLFASGKVYKTAIEIEKASDESIYANQIVFMGSFIDRCIQHVFSSFSDVITTQKILDYVLDTTLNEKLVENRRSPPPHHLANNNDHPNGEHKTHQILNDQIMKLTMLPQTSDEIQPTNKIVFNRSTDHYRFVENVFSVVEEEPSSSTTAVKIIKRKNKEEKSPTAKNEDMIKRHLQKASLLFF